jgi:hypothetical protein
MSKSITHTLTRLQNGLFVDKCTDLFTEVLRHVELTGKPGKLTITLDVKKVNSLVSVLAKATDKVPELPPDADMFYLTDDIELSVDNPKQRRLDLRPVESSREVRPAESRTPVREGSAGDHIDPETGEVLPEQRAATS